MSDLIERQAILKHIEKIRQGAQMMSDMHRVAVIMGMDLLEEAVNNQPSAQPEIIRCKDCKHNANPPEAGNADCDLFYGMTEQYGFCHRAERRTRTDE